MWTSHPAPSFYWNSFLMSFKCPQIFIKRPSLTVCKTWSGTFLWIFLNLPTAGPTSVRVNGLKTTRTFISYFCPWSNCLSVVVSGVASKNRGNIFHAMEKSVHYISKVKKRTISHRLNGMVLNAYTFQKEPKGINETHLFARNLRF